MATAEMSVRKNYRNLHRQAREWFKGGVSSQTWAEAHIAAGDNSDLTMRVYSNLQPIVPTTVGRMLATRRWYEQRFEQNCQTPVFASAESRSLFQTRWGTFAIVSECNAVSHKISTKRLS